MLRIRQHRISYPDPFEATTRQEALAAIESGLEQVKRKLAAESRWNRIRLGISAVMIVALSVRLTSLFVANLKLTWVLALVLIGALLAAIVSLVHFVSRRFNEDPFADERKYHELVRRYQAEILGVAGPIPSGSGAGKPEAEAVGPPGGTES